MRPRNKGNSFFGSGRLSQGSSLEARGEKGRGKGIGALPPEGPEKSKRTAIMPTTVHFLAPLALMLPGASVDSPSVQGALQRGLDEQWAAASIPSGPPMADGAFDQQGFADFITGGLSDDSWSQVRVEQRMIIRIAPRMPGQMFAPIPQAPQPPRFYERKTAKCLPIASIAGVQAESPGRLMLITRNRKLIGASLDKSCRARDFYSGFYVERNEDGQLCAGRDVIHSRAGANCAVTKMRELVPDDD